ncbi:hypothetical protein AYI68_g6880 [Smittium mucronatum]|uniref:Uncharacterized protein n=1 Tax=Smittium mucronatum TaxID=133383 RepID=A0A1R0GQA2_9FUNG|nr:hypothetical protein AYI68_g6880 [Smittium mucronatum]
MGMQSLNINQNSGQSHMRMLNQHHPQSGTPNQQTQNFPIGNIQNQSLQQNQGMTRVNPSPLSTIIQENPRVDPLSLLVSSGMNLSPDQIAQFRSMEPAKQLSYVQFLLQNPGNKLAQTGSSMINQSIPQHGSNYGTPNISLSNIPQNPMLSTINNLGMSNNFNSGSDQMASNSHLSFNNPNLLSTGDFGSSGNTPVNSSLNTPSGSFASFGVQHQRMPNMNNPNNMSNNVVNSAKGGGSVNNNLIQGLNPANLTPHQLNMIRQLQIQNFQRQQNQ